MFDSFIKALGWSAVLHLVVITLLWYFQQPPPAPVAAQAIAAFIYQPTLRPAQPPMLNPPEITPEAPQKTAPSPVPQTIEHSPRQTAPALTSELSAQPQVTTEPPDTTQQATTNTTTDKSDDISQPATHATKPIQDTGAAMSLAERSLAIVNRRHTDVSSAALAASQQRPALRDRPATTAKMQVAPEHAAANVLMQRSDGSFIEKVGDYCYLAKPGADLRKDIFSMKPVPCGEDKNAALYDRIMSKVGQDR